MSHPSHIDRRTFVKTAAAAGAAAVVGPQILVRSARGADAKRVVFVSEESNPKAIAVYDKINADFKKETGIEVVMEYPGFANIAKRVATLIAAGTPPEIVWYGAGQAMNLALENQLADVGDVLKATGGTADNLRLIYKGADRSIPTSQQFTYGWYRKDLFQAKGLDAPKSWEDYLKAARALNNPPIMYGCIVPSAETGASTLLLETMFMKNNVHWFAWNAGKKDYEVVLDQGEQKKRAVETLDYLNELHKCSPEASTYNWGELMSTYFTEKAASSWYVGSRLLDQTIANNPKIADATVPFELPRKLTDAYYLSIQGFHILEKSNVDGAKKYVTFFLKHPDLISWYHAVPLHIIPASRQMLNSTKYQDNAVIQKRMDVLKFLDSIWTKGVPLYYWDGKELNPYIGLFHNENLAGWMLAARNIKGMKSEQVVDEAAAQVRKKMRRVS
jgi:multiple sugar transport system substrate-binding protein